MLLIISYLISLVAFVAIDASWLTLFGSKLYRAALGDLLAPSIRVAPAIAFYALYPMGLLYFAVLPGLEQSSPYSAFVKGSVLGAMAYATYELTNFATLRNWTLQITAIDIVYGALASGAVGALAVITTPPIVAFLSGTSR